MFTVMLMLIMIPLMMVAMADDDVDDIGDGRAAHVGADGGEIDARVGDLGDNHTDGYDGVGVVYDVDGGANFGDDDVDANIVGNGVDHDGGPGCHHVDEHVECVVFDYDDADDQADDLRNCRVGDGYGQGDVGDGMMMKSANTNHYPCGQHRYH